MRAARKKATRRNSAGELSAAARLSEKFHGRPAKRATEFTASHRQRTVQAELGKLIELSVKTPKGDRATLGFEGCEVFVTAAPDGGQIYFEQGDQAIDLKRLGLSDQLPKDRVLVGTALSIVYEARKGFDDFELIDYRHKFGEDGGQAPQLYFDTLNARLELAGGTYQVKADGVIR